MPNRKKPLFESPSGRRARENPARSTAANNRAKDVADNRMGIGSPPKAGTRGTPEATQRSQFHAAVINRGNELKTAARTSDNPRERSLANKRLFHNIGPYVRGDKFYQQQAIDEKVKKAGTI